MTQSSVVQQVIQQANAKVNMSHDNLVSAYKGGPIRVPKGFFSQDVQVPLNVQANKQQQ